MVTPASLATFSHSKHEWDSTLYGFSGDSSRSRLSTPTSLATSLPSNDSSMFDGSITNNLPLALKEVEYLRQTLVHTLQSRMANYEAFIGPTLTTSSSSRESESSVNTNTSSS